MRFHHISHYISSAAVLIAVLWAGACSSQQEDSVSVLHHFNRGNEAYRIEDYRRAIVHFNRALELDGTLPDIQYNLGLAHYRAGNYERAVAAFRGALKARPNMPDAHYNLALAYDRLFNADAAHTHYNAYRDMVSGTRDIKPAAAPGGLAGPQPGAKALAAGAQTRDAARATKGIKRGQPIPKVNQTGRGASRSSARSPVPARPAGHRPAAHAASRTGNSRAPAAQPAYPAPPAPRRNAQNSSGDQQKWWIQERFNRTR